MATPAQAHDELVSSSPAANSTITDSPAEVTLTFSGELIAGMQSAAVEVIAPDGQNIATDAPSEDGTSITQRLTPDPPAGTFTVRWKVVSGDGHPISGEYTYTIEPIAVTSSPTATPSTAQQTPVPSPNSTETSAGSGYGGETSGGGAAFPIIAAAGGAIILGGVVVAVLMVGRERRRRDRADAARAAHDTTAGKESTDES
ncbi:copper resistance protein CopC [Planococcus sp. APC 4015]|nr:copper resistance protein CopC [Planococcus sp. APC 4015]